MQITLLLLLSQFFFWSYPIDWQMNQQNAVVRGSVVDEGTGQAVAGATIYAVSPGDVERTISDASGNFIFLTLLPGTYRLCAAKAEYGLDCSAFGSQPESLYGGFEYGATVVLSKTIN
jgi:hypothetical protein